MRLFTWRRPSAPSAARARQKLFRRAAVRAGALADGPGNRENAVVDGPTGMPIAVVSGAEGPVRSGNLESLLWRLDALDAENAAARAEVVAVVEGFNEIGSTQNY